jgi:hypothetical protein
MAAVVLGLDAVLGSIGWHDAGVIITTLRIMLLTSAGAVAFVIGALILGLRELRVLPGMVLRRRRAPEVL